MKRTTRYAATPKVKRNAADGLFTKPSNVQIGHAQGVFLDKFAPRFYLVSHEDGKDFIRFYRIFHANLQQGAGLRVHGRLPELFRVHFAQAFVALDLDPFLAEGEDLLDQLGISAHFFRLLPGFQLEGRRAQGAELLGDFPQLLKLGRADQL